MVTAVATIRGYIRSTECRRVFVRTVRGRMLFTTPCLPFEVVGQANEAVRTGISRIPAIKIRTTVQSRRCAQLRGYKIRGRMPHQ